MQHTPQSANPSLPHNPPQLDGALAPPPKHRRLIPAGVQPTNFIHISAVDSIQGVYIIDPGLAPPSSLTAPYPYGHQTGQNAFIESQKGNVNVDFFVLPSSDDQNMVSMTLKSQNGSACVRVVRHLQCASSSLHGRLFTTTTCSMTLNRRTAHTFVGP